MWVDKQGFHTEKFEQFKKFFRKSVDKMLVWKSFWNLKKCKKMQKTRKKYNNGWNELHEYQIL